MRSDNLLAVQPRSFVVTTDSGHEFEVCLNLASRLKLTGLNQLWVADITYIRLHSEFVYLAVVLDGFSRKVIGWELGRTLEARLAIAALEQALAARQPPPGPVDHSDRGVQYACHGYRQVLERHRMLASMSRPANPYDNACCESFIKTLKREEICASEWGSSSRTITTAIGAGLSAAGTVRAGPRCFRSGAGSEVEFLQASGDLSIRCAGVNEGEPPPEHRTNVDSRISPPRHAKLLDIFHISQAFANHANNGDFGLYLEARPLVALAPAPGTTARRLLEPTICRDNV